MKLKKGQSQTESDKLIDEYHNQIKKTSVVNNDLNQEISILQNKIIRNHEILSSLLPKPTTLLLEMETEIKKYYSLLDQKSQLQTQSNKYQQILTNLPIEIETMKSENSQLKKALENKITRIEKLEKAMTKERKKGVFKDAFEEVYVISPTPQALSSYNIIPDEKKSPCEKKRNSKLSDQEYERQVYMHQIALKSVEIELEKGKLNNPFNTSVKNMINTSYSDRSKQMMGDTSETDESMNSNIDENAFALDIQLNSNDGIIMNDNNVYDINSQSEDFDIRKEIEKLKKEKKRLEKIDMKDKEEIIDHKTNHEKMKNEIKRLSKIIKTKTNEKKHNGNSTQSMQINNINN